MDCSPIQPIPELIISQSGIFKYILIQIFFKSELIGQVVRGDTKFSYHADNFKAFKQELKSYGFTNLSKTGDIIKGQKEEKKFIFKCPGGGRIEHNHKGKKCSVYGYSKTYGHVDHKIARQAIMKNLGYKEEEIVLNEKQY